MVPDLERRDRILSEPFPGVGLLNFYGSFESRGGFAPSILEDRFQFKSLRDTEIKGVSPLSGAYFAHHDADASSALAPFEMLRHGYHKLIILRITEYDLSQILRAAIAQTPDMISDVRDYDLAAPRGFLGSRWYARATARQIVGALRGRCKGQCTDGHPCREFGCICNPALGRCV